MILLDPCRGDQVAHVPFTGRLWCSVAEACEVIGEGRTKLFEKVASGELVSRKAGTRRLISVQSLLRRYGESAVMPMENEAPRIEAGQVRPSTPVRETHKSLPDNGEGNSRPRPP